MSQGSLAQALLRENTSLKEFEPWLAQSPMPTLGDVLGANHLPAVHLRDIPIAVPYAVALFNKGYYWETHEVLEDVWMDEYGPTRSFLQGFIQAAAALYHVVAQNPAGYERLSGLARAKLSGPQRDSLGVDLGACLQAFDGFDAAHAGQLRFDLNHLPKIRFAGILL